MLSQYTDDQTQSFCHYVTMSFLLRRSIADVHTNYSDGKKAYQDISVQAGRVSEHQNTRLLCN